MPNGEEFALSELKLPKNDQEKAVSGRVNTIKNVISKARIRAELQLFCDTDKQSITLIETTQNGVPVVFDKDSSTRCEKLSNGIYRIENMMMRL